MAKAREEHTSSLKSQAVVSQPDSKIKNNTYAYDLPDYVFANERAFIGKAIKFSKQTWMAPPNEKFDTGFFFKCPENNKTKLEFTCFGSGSMKIRTYSENYDLIKHRLSIMKIPTTGISMLPWTHKNLLAMDFTSSKDPATDQAKAYHILKQQPKPTPFEIIVYNVSKNNQIETCEFLNVTDNNTTDKQLVLEFNKKFRSGDYNIEIFQTKNYLNKYDLTNETFKVPLSFTEGDKYFKTSFHSKNNLGLVGIKFISEK